MHIFHVTLYQEEKLSRYGFNINPVSKHILKCSFIGWHFNIDLQYFIWTAGSRSSDSHFQNQNWSHRFCQSLSLLSSSSLVKSRNLDRGNKSTSQFYTISIRFKMLGAAITIKTTIKFSQLHVLSNTNSLITLIYRLYISTC